MADKVELKEVLHKMLETPFVLFTLVGVALFLLGLSGGVKYHDWLPVADVTARVALSVGSVALVAAALIRVPNASNSLPKSSTHGIKINFPPEGTDQENQVEVRGTIGKPLPPGYELRIVRHYGGKERGLVPTAVATFDADGTWHASGCAIGGKPGDRRAIAAYIVGPNAQALIEYFF